MSSWCNIPGLDLFTLPGKELWHYIHSVDTRSSSSRKEGFWLRNKNRRTLVVIIQIDILDVLTKLLCEYYKEMKYSCGQRWAAVLNRKLWLLFAGSISTLINVHNFGKEIYHYTGANTFILWDHNVANTSNVVNCQLCFYYPYRIRQDFSCCL